MGFFDKMFGDTKKNGADTATESERSEIIDALAMHVRGEFDPALSLYLKILEKSGDDIASFFASAITAAKGNVSAAAENLRFLSQRYDSKGEVISQEISLALDALTSEALYLGSPAIAEIIVSFGDQLKSQGFVRESAVCFEIASSLVPDNAHVLHKFADTLHDMGIYEYAEKILQHALTYAPYHWGSLYTYAVLLQDLGRFDEAIANYEKAVMIDPDHVKCQNNYGAALMSVNRLDEAFIHCTLASELDPHFPQAKINLGNIHLMKQEYDTARNCFNEAISLDDSIHMAHFGLGVAEQALGSDAALVRASFLKALELNPSMALYHLALGKLLANEGNIEALSHFSTAVELDTNLAGLHRDFANACLQMGRRDEALEHLEIALAQDPGDAEARELLARTK